MCRDLLVVIAYYWQISYPDLLTLRENLGTRFIISKFLTRRISQFLIIQLLYSLLRRAFFEFPGSSLDCWDWLWVFVLLWYESLSVLGTCRQRCNDLLQIRKRLAGKESNCLVDLVKTNWIANEEKTINQTKKLLKVGWSLMLQSHGCYNVKRLTDCQWDE